MWTVTRPIMLCVLTHDSLSFHGMNPILQQTKRKEGAALSYVTRLVAQLFLLLAPFIMEWRFLSLSQRYCSIASFS